jgi:predicted RNA binding protein YcfA (HicA-like mRNA interferase family)
VPSSKAGMYRSASRASHKQFRHEDGRATTVPFHKGRDIAPRLLRQVASDIGLTIEELLRCVEGLKNTLFLAPAFKFLNSNPIASAFSATLTDISEPGYEALDSLHHQTNHILPLSSSID